VLPVYMHIRVCVSSYLFLSGFGHMTYFWSRGFKGCLVRGLRVLFRMNVLVVCLCLVMNRPYQFYYFVPLVSHWFLVTFFMAVAWPRVCQATLDRRPGFTLAAAAAKLGVVVLLVSLLYASEYAFSKLFLSGPARSLFVASEDRSREWRFRWSLDRYSSLAGAAAAICIQAARHFRLLDDSHQGDLAGRGVAAGLSLVGLLACLSYTAFADCNSVHPLLVVLPILGYACVRNVWGSLRQRYSVFFAWFGRIALELFIAQYHRPACAHIPSNYVLNLITTSFIFVCLAHEVHSITRLLTPYAVPDDWRLAMRNLLIFCAPCWCPSGPHGCSTPAGPAMPAAGLAAALADLLLPDPGTLRLPVMAVLSQRSGPANRIPRAYSPLDVYFLVARLVPGDGRRQPFIVADNFLVEGAGLRPAAARHERHAWHRGDLRRCAAPGPRRHHHAPGGLREALFADPFYSIEWSRRPASRAVAISAGAPIYPVFTTNIREGIFCFRPGLGLLRRLYERTRLPLVITLGYFPVKLRTFIDGRCCRVPARRQRSWRGGPRSECAASSTQSSGCLAASSAAS
uniref:Cas1_AcylT domain-containing protein n=1 Tax=Macrostomum lignano TaxID=282301 RepID=A0A1I8F3D2_9PLAT